MKKNIIFSLLILFSINLNALQDGQLDPTFNSGDATPGANVNDFGVGSSTSFAKAIAFQAPEYLILAGQTVIAGMTQFALARYNGDGELDNVFGSGTGLVTTIFPGQSFSSANDVVVRPGENGKIIAIGSAFVGGSTQFALVGYTDIGALDPSFNGTGRVLTDILAGATDTANAGVLQADQKLVAVGISSIAIGANFLALARYNTDGSLDTTFSNPSSTPGVTPGTIRIQLAGQITTGNDVVMQLVNGVEKILVVGTLGFIGTAYYLARFNLDGSFDTSFGSGTGFVSGNFAIPIVSSTGSSLALQNDKIIVAGLEGGTTVGFARYNSDGQLDTTFGTNGVFLTPAMAMSNVQSIKTMPDGKIVAAGYTGNNQEFVVMRLTANGALDNTFGTAGVTVVPYDAYGYVNGGAYDLVVQPDLKISAAGVAVNGFAFALGKFAVARLIGVSSTFVEFIRPPTPADGATIDNPRPTITVRTYPGNSVSIFRNEVFVGGGTADANGEFSLTSPFDLANGFFTVRAAVRDAAGNLASATTTFTIDTISCTLPADELTLALREKYL